MGSDERSLAAFEKVHGRHACLLDANAAAFCARVYGTPRARYLDRLRAIGFEGHGRVLDAGCGFGQWALALAELNQRVDAVDVASDRLFFLERLLDELPDSAVVPRYARTDALPFADGVFDAVFSYGVVMCTPWKESLAEIARVLRPGGRLYLTANDLGWYLHQWRSRPHATEGFDPRESAARSLKATLAYERHGVPPDGCQVLIRQEAMQAQLSQLGFRVEGIGPDASIRVDPSLPQPEPFFPAEYHGEPGPYEVLAEKT